MVDKKTSVLIVDDEKNIRLTLTQTLKSLDIEIDTAVNGEEALQKIIGKKYDILLLNFHLPGMNGIEVLRKLRDIRPDISVIVITAYGSVDSAVEAMKLGAVEYVQKPFIPDEIRTMVKNIINHETIDEQKAEDYTFYTKLAKKCINARQFYSAEKHIKQAIMIDNSRPEAYNVFGTLREVNHDIDEALKLYREALSRDATYEPARNNLARREKLMEIQEKYKGNKRRRND